MAAAAPIYNSAGLLTGYQGQQQKIPLSLSPQYSPGGLLTGYSPSQVTGSPAVAPEYSNSLTTPTSTASGNVVGGSSQSTQPGGLLTKQTPGQQAAGQLLNNTAVVAEPKNPAITAATSNLLGDSQNVADQATKTFDDYLNEAKTATAGIQTQVATDTANLNALPGQTAARLNAINQNYANTTGNISNQYANLNQANVQTVGNDIADLSTINNNYATAAQNVADRAVQYAGGQIGKYQGGSGTPTSNSSDLENRYQQAYTDINLPVQQQIYQNQLGQLQNYITPLQEQLYGQNVNQAVNYNTTAANQIASMQTGSAEQIAALQQMVAGRSVSEAQQYLQSLGIPIQVAQQVLNGPTSNLATLTGVDSSNTNYGIASAYQPAVTSLPNNSNQPQRQPQLGGYGNGAPNVQTGAQPMGANGQPATAVDGNGQPIIDPTTGMPIVSGSAAFYNYASNLSNPLSNPNSAAWPPVAPGPGNGANQYQAALAMYQAGYINEPPNPADYGLTASYAPPNPATSNQQAAQYASYASAGQAGNDYVNP
jgi:hypothetical protein